MIKKAGAGGSVLLLADAGDYKVSGPINITAAMSGAGVTIKGVTKAGADMDAHIEGTRPATYSATNAAGNELFKFQAGASGLTFENLSVANTGTVFRAAGDVSNITIQHIEADNVQRFFEDYAGGSNKTATVTGLTIRDVDVEGFSKGVIRLQYNSSNILIEDVRGDSERQDGDDFAIGVHLAGTVHDVVISRTTMENATATTTGTYWNGDGFATESQVYNVTFKDTISRGNTDAGYDLKSKSTTLINALAEDNSRNYRVWGDVVMVDSVGLDPDKRGGATNSQTQVWVAAGAKLDIKGGYFSDAGTGTSVFYNEGGKVTLSGTDVTYSATGAKLVVGSAVTGLAASDVTKVDAVGKTSSTADLGVVVYKATVTENEGYTSIKATATGEVFSATAKSEHFIFDQTAKMGSDVIQGFGKNDVLVTTKKLADGNGDGLIAFGSNNVIDLGYKAGNVKIAGLASVRALGQTDEGFVYGVASVRPKGAVESKLGVSDTLQGDKADKAVNKFFFDTALDLGLGEDKIVSMGVKDILVTTAKLSDGAAGSKLTATSASAGFDLHKGAHDLGGVLITDTAGSAVNVIEFDGSKIVGGVEYFVYSLVGSAAGVADLA
ncbi:hypothetical protein [Caulobacter hibisci]|uniref:Uncharacterized protein n=1 Tax=Caulobacter hibisci TaxID=2035993 RepID=A0ABS0T3F6_9CAUL|nr:hypothetical protein [Caulobacter hibisci]MBI1686417.1 hypothetical protein [Caulobacter hibisci]